MLLVVAAGYGVQHYHSLAKVHPLRELFGLTKTTSLVLCVLIPSREAIFDI